MQGLFFEGIFLQASLIMALGAQNLFILESGLKRQNYITASFVCFLCDLALIMLGVLGAGTFLNEFPKFKILIGLIGCLFLFHYGFSKIFQPQLAFKESELLNTKESLRRCIILALTFSILNPHAYVDAFILIGGYSSKYAEISQRASIGLGAASFSLIWFLLLSGLSSKMRSFFMDQKRMRGLTMVSGCLLLSIAYNLSKDVYSWIGLDWHLIKSLFLKIS